MAYIVSSGFSNDGTTLTNNSMTVLNGGVANNTTVSSYGVLIVSSGGNANNAKVSSGGGFYVSSGGTANSTTVYSRGGLYVLKSATANTINVNSSGYLIVSGGTANNATIKNGGVFSVSSGGVANSTTVNSGGSMVVYSGGTATDIVWTPGEGYFYAVNGAVVTFASQYSGVYYGSANQLRSHATVMTDVVVGSRGEIFAMSGGTANRISVNSSGHFYIFSGGTANNATINGSSWMYVSSGGTANNTSIGWNGLVNVFGGFLDDTIVYTSGNITIFSGGEANRIIVHDSGWITISSGGTANNVVLNSGSWMHVSSGGTATIAFNPYVDSNDLHVFPDDEATITYLERDESVYYGYQGALVRKASMIDSMTVTSGYSSIVYSGGITNDITLSGVEVVLSGGVANRTSIKSQGELIISSGGIANNTLVYRSGTINVCSGGTATIAFNPWGGTVSSSNGAIVTFLNPDANVYYGNWDGLLSKADSMDALDIEKEAIIYSGGTIKNATVSGNLFVSAYGTANSTTVRAGGGLFVSSGGTANSTTVSSGGSIFIFNGGTANSTMINRDGKVYVSSGGITKDSFVFSKGNMTVSSAGTASDATIFSSGNISVSSGGIASGTIIESGGTLCLFSGGTANNTSVNNDGFFIVSSGGFGNSTTIFSKGVEYLSDAGTASNTVIKLGGRLVLSKGAMATKTTVYSNGILQIISGATATGVVAASGARLEVSVAANTHIEGTSGGKVFEIKDGIVSSFAFENGLLSVLDNGEVQSVIVGSGGILVAEKGNALDVAVRTSGQFQMSSGTASNVEIESGGSLSVFKGGKLTGIMSFAKGAQVMMSADSELHFDITALTPDKSIAIVNDFSLINGTPDYTFTASDDQIQGKYILARGANSFTGVITIQTQNKDFLGILGVGESFNTSNASYSLSLEQGGILALEINTITPRIILSGNNETPTRSTALTATSESDGEIFFSVDNTHWTKYENEITITDNITYYFKTTDSNGNIGTNWISFYNIDTVAPEKPTATANVTTNTTGSVLVNAIFSEDSVIKEYQLNAGEWRAYTEPVKFTENGIVSFRGTDAAGNVSDITSYEVTNIEKVIPDTTLPIVSNVQASITMLTNQDVVLTADFADDVELAQSLYKLGEDGEWTAYVDGVTVKENRTVYFKAVDTSRNESEIVSYTVSNIDKGVPSDPTGVRAFVERQDVALLWNGSTDEHSGVKEYVVTYSINGQEFTVRTSNTNYVLNNADFGSYSWSVQAVDFAGNESAVTTGDAFTVSGFKPYTVEYSPDNFEHVITFAVTTPSLDAFRMPTGIYQMRVKQEGSSEWLTGDPIVAPETDIEPQLIKSDADSNADVFFANAVGTWESMYLAQHVGSINDWAGTNEYASVSGKNKLADIIEGSTDANILLMTDDDNGDALFVDDIYSALPGSVPEQQARIAQIDEIRAGFGNDIVDMTSQRFEYIGEGLTIRGGEGNDTIWVNKGDNFLFGDAGNDRIVGASGNDVIAGGIGNDRLHGGGGNDVFTFCDNWGVDNVEQLATGSVTLWFASGSETNWNSETLTYADGENSVKVSGVAAEKVTLKFGDDGTAQFASLTSMGAFFDATTERIFEETGKGILASL